MRNLEVERVAESQYLIRPILVKALESRTITPEGQAHLSVAATNMLELWQSTFADRWYDMVAVVRLGTAIETGLRDVHTRTAAGGAKMDRGLFQRLVDPRAIEKAFSAISIDLAVDPEWLTMREIMLHRHLYAHRAGVPDDEYLDGHLAVTGRDIRPDVQALWLPLNGGVLVPATGSDPSLHRVSAALLRPAPLRISAR